MCCAYLHKTMNTDHGVVGLPGKYLIESTLPSKEFGKLPPEGKPCSPYSDVLLQPQVLHLMLHPEGQGQRSRSALKKK